jgi:hypothetical protein
VCLQGVDGQNTVNVIAEQAQVGAKTSGQNMVTLGPLGITPKTGRRMFGGYAGRGQARGKGAKSDKD